MNAFLNDSLLVVVFLNKCIVIQFSDAFFTPYIGHGDSVRIVDAELGTLEREHVHSTTTRRRGLTRRESSSGMYKYLPHAVYVILILTHRLQMPAIAIH